MRVIIFISEKENCQKLYKWEKNPCKKGKLNIINRLKTITIRFLFAMTFASINKDLVLKLACHDLIFR